MLPRDEFYWVRAFKKIKLGRLIWFQQNSARLYIACPQLWHNFWTTTFQTHRLPNTGFPPTLEGSPMQSSFCVHKGWPIANFGNLKSHILRLFSCFVKLTTKTIHINMTIYKIHDSLTNKTSTNFTRATNWSNSSRSTLGTASLEGIPNAQRSQSTLATYLWLWRCKMQIPKAYLASKVSQRMNRPKTHSKINLRSTQKTHFMWKKVQTDRQTQVSFRNPIKPDGLFLKMFCLGLVAESLQIQNIPNSWNIHVPSRSKECLLRSHVVRLPLHDL